jgi:exodeoxyribonuclease VII large subunit
LNDDREPDPGAWPESAALVTGAEREVLTVRQVNEEIAAAVARSFPRTIWVRGEVQRLPADADRRTHVYFELHETGASGAAEYQLSASLMGWDRQRFGLGRYLDGTDPDFQIANKIEVCLECKVDFYAKFGKLSLKVVGVDKSFALGRLEAVRRRTLAYLDAQGLLGRNAAVPLPVLPLHVGLITSPGSAAAHDFQTGLVASGWAFRVNLVGARMQGDQLQAEVLQALRRQIAAGVDVIVITRGGGSRADLSWFDQQELAVAIAGCPVPVITAIGHEIDRSIADVVAHHSCKTPTAAAEFLVVTVGAVAAQVDQAARRLSDLVAGILHEAERRVDVTGQLVRAAAAGLGRAEIRYERAAGRLQRLVGDGLADRRLRVADLKARLAAVSRLHLVGAEQRLTRLGQGLARQANDTLDLAARGMQLRRERLAREAVRPLAPWARRLASCETESRLLDPARLLKRGYTITLGPDGRAVGAAAGLAAGDLLTTVLSDGRVQSIVQPGGHAGPSRNRKARKRGGKTGKSDAGQKALFR